VHKDANLVHKNADAEPKSRPKWARDTLQDAGYFVGDPTDTKRNRFNFEEPPLAVTAIELMPPKNIFLVQSSDPQSYGKVVENPFWESAMHEEYKSSSRTRLGIWFPFLQEGNLSGAYVSLQNQECNGWTG
jgi:hypothetical protein